MKKRMTSLVLALLMVLTLLPVQAWAEVSGDFTYTLEEDGSATITEYTGDAEEVEIPLALDGHPVTQIGSSAIYANYVFSECKNLKKVIISESVKHIRNHIFLECENLETVTIPDSLVSIGNRMFAKCPKIKDVVIPNSVTSIGDELFWFCGDVGRVDISARVTNVGNWYCSNDVQVYFDGTTAEWLERGGNFQTTIADLGDTVYHPEAILHTKDGAYRELGYRSYGYTDTEANRKCVYSLTTDGRLTYGGCTVVDNLYNYNYDDERVTALAFEEGVTTLSKTGYLNDYCSNFPNLKTIYIPKSLTMIDSGSFNFNSSVIITDVYYGGTQEEWEDLRGMCYGGNNGLYDGVTIHYNYNYELPLDPGNVNGQGGIDATDVQCLFDFLLGRQELTDSQQKAADYNGDGVVDVYDLQALYEYVAYHSN